ncbi:MAG: hypothetical protein EA376_10320 [Phycisphaeraceae bacterium]|nr:MAG: hypothetical protein EA376_10320 [Phycisphaeraceae bacterium]
MTVAVYRFELERLLEMRTRTEREKQQVVAEIERERLEIENQLRDRQRTIMSTKDDLRAALQGERADEGVGVIDLRSVRMQSTAALHDVVRAQETAIRLAGIHNRLGAARGELMRATTARKAVDLLKKRRYERWLREQNRKEAAEMDEIAIMRAQRRDESPESEDAPS